MTRLILALALMLLPAAYAENVNPKVFSFKTMSPPFGTNPIASSATDTLTFTSADNSCTIVGNTSDKSLDWSCSGGGGGGGITQINGNTNAHQIIQAGSGITVVSSGGTTTISNTGGSGTVTSVGVNTDSTTSSVFANTTNSITGSPITGNGAMTLTLSNQSSNKFLAGPTSGPAGAPVFRSVVSGDIPTLNQNTTGTASNITGILLVANGGTNSNVALNNNRIMISASGAVVEQSALTASRALITDGSGLPITSTTTATQISFVDATSSIQTQLNGKAGSFTAGTISTSTTGVSIGSGTNATVGPNTTVNIQTASGSQPGLLSATDWGTFNGKQSALTIGDLSTTTTGISLSGNTGAVIGSGATINIQTASTSLAGLLSSADWNTFNGKQSAGNYATSGSGDVSWSATMGGGAVTTAIGANKVANSQLAQMAATTIKGNSTGSTANASDLSGSTVTGLLSDFVGDSGSGGVKGLVPAPASGDAAAGKFLKADGSWSVSTGITGPGSTTSGNLVVWNSSTGAVVKDSNVTIGFSGNPGFTFPSGSFIEDTNAGGFLGVQIGSPANTTVDVFDTGIFLGMAGSLTKVYVSYPNQASVASEIVSSIDSNLGCDLTIRGNNEGTNPTGSKTTIAGGAAGGVFNGPVQIGMTSSTPQHILNTNTLTPASGILTLTNGPSGFSGNPAGYIDIIVNGNPQTIPYW